MEYTAMPEEIQIPMTLTHLFTKTESGCIGHSLDFDIVAVAEDRTAAEKKLALAIKTYVEFGLSKGWKTEILFPAPEEYRASMKPGPAAVLPTIEIAGRKSSVFAASHDETLSPAC
jgi:hypothetical protein